MSEPRLLGITGSLRRDSHSTAILRTIADHHGSFSLFPVETVPLYNEDLEAELPDAITALRGAIATAEGLVIVTPEFNHGIPGVLKNLLDWASRPHNHSVMRGKLVLTITCAPGFIGGARAQAQLNETLHAMLAQVLLRPQIVIGHVHQKIENGRLAEANSLRHLLDGVHDLVRDIRDRKQPARLPA